MTQLRIIISTVADQQTAAHIARDLVEGRFAACVNLLPSVRSIYRWAGSIHDEQEILLLIKTPVEQVDAAIGKLRELHPYEVPEIVVLEPSSVDPAYDAWLLESSRESST